MGWLKTLLQLANPPISGYGELARLVLQHPEWPSDTRPQPRSLAALLSKLDRGIELEWLADREAVQRVLALTLGCSLDAVRAEAEISSAPSASPPQRVRLQDVPYARPLDLLDESLPPGVPPEAQRSATWRNSWWLAPSGSGRTLTGLWLKARGLAEFVSAASWSEAVAKLPPSGPTFVELERDAAGLDLAALPYPELCIAAPFPPPGDGAGWRAIASPSLLDALPGLLEWLGARLPEDGAFDHLRAFEWLKTPVARGEVPTLGAVLGVAGVLDATGMQGLDDKSLVDVARGYVGERLEEAAKGGSPEALWLKRHGFDVLLGIAQRALTHSAHPWEVARSLDEWIELVPDEFRQGVDTEWIRWSLARAAGPSTVRQFEQALKEAPPGAYRLVRTLVDARLLRQQEPGPRYLIAPEFVKHAAAAKAQSDLLGASATLAWADALLWPHAAPKLMQSLYERLRAERYDLVEHVLDQEDFSAAPSAAALEAVFTCLGLALLEGCEVPTEYVRGIWDAQLELLLELPEQLPEPRVAASELALGGGAARALLHADTWRLAALALSEHLPERGHAQHDLLRPWSASAPPPGMARLLGNVYRTLSEPGVAAQPWALAAFALAGRLEQRGLIPPPASAGASAPPATSEAPELEPALAALLCPARIVRALLAANLRWEVIAGLGASTIDVRALCFACERQAIAWPRMAQAIWHAWTEAGCPSDGDRLLGPESAHKHEFWPHLPGASLGRAWRRWAPEASAWPYALFGKAQWSAFVKRWCAEVARDASAAQVAHWQGAFAAIEQSWAALALNEAGLLGPNAALAVPIFELLWRRFPAWLVELLASELSRGNRAAATSLLASAPSQQTPAIVALLRSELGKREAELGLLDTARAWLRRNVAARHPGWRDAYSLLGELEARAKRARRALGPET